MAGVSATDAEQFLARVVGPGNYAVITWKDPSRDGMAARFFPRDRVSDAAGFARWVSGKGSDAYFGVAGFLEAIPDGNDARGKPKFRGTRVVENVDHLRALWIDIDVKRAGDNKTKSIYADRREALAWLLGFINATGLPPPNLWVDSGYGYHVYWILEDALTRAEWQPYADALAAAIRVHGFKCEAGISSDAARILRPPGTMNCKGGTQVPVRVLDKQSRGDYPNELVLDKLRPYVGIATPTTVVQNASSALAGGAASAAFAGTGAPNMNAAAQANMPVARQHEFAKIAMQCEQVKQSLAAQGNGDHYQLWYLGFLSLAHHCVDGDQFVHEISKGDPRYTQQQTDAMVARIASEKARKDRGPPRCTSFDGWRPGVCTTCPHFNKVTSPWSLGTDKPSGVTVATSNAPAIATISDLPKLMAPDEALRRLNEIFFFAHDWGGEPLIGHITADGVRPLSEQQFRSSLANRYVEVQKSADAGKAADTIHISAGKWWLANPQRREYERVLYDPEHVRCHEHDFNLWTGFARTARPGAWSKMARHIYEIICKRDREVWRYLIRWIAHAIQHPGSAPGTVVVLKSDVEGTGKSTLLEWIARMFGEHALLLNTPEDLVGEFNDHLENKSFIGLNEPAFPGDYRAAEKLKSMITESTWLLNGKYRKARRVPNIAHIMLTSNENWVVPAGRHARRFLVLDVDPRRAGDRTYFSSLWAEADAGGVEAMLHALLRVDLSNFNFRDVPRTAALREQQLMSASTITRWAVDAASTQTLIAPPMGGTGTGGSSGAGVSAGGGFGARYSFSQLYDEYSSWTTNMRQRKETKREFGLWLNRCGFKRKMVRGVPTYDIPDARVFGAAAIRDAGIR